MLTSAGHYCCDNFDLTLIQFKVAIRQAKKANEKKGESGKGVGLEAIQIQKENEK